MSSKQSSDVPLWTVLRENAKLVVMYGLGTAVVGVLWWPLALLILCALFGFVVVPRVSRDICATCENAKNLPAIQGAVRDFRTRDGGA